MAKETRLERVELFKKFSKEVESVFLKFKEDIGKYQKFEDYYMLSICPGGRAGGLNERQIEVFYGNRPYDIETKIGKEFQKQESFLLEHGTTLSFNLNDHGYVAVILSPSGTDYTKSLESAVFVNNYVHPKRLFRKWYLKYLWKIFNAYMECTSIDGSPDFSERFIVWYLRNFKNLIIEGKYQPKNIHTWATKIFNYVTTVGLSGFIIFLFTIIIPQRCSSDPLLKETEGINQKMDSIINIQKEIRNSIFESTSVDSHDKTSDD